MPDINVTLALPVSSIYIALNALVMLWLAFMVVRARQANAKADGSKTEARDNWVRAHGNNIEYVPIALLLMVGLEFFGVATWFLHALGAVLTLSRIAHGYGRGTSDGANPGRMFGTLGTWLVVLIGALALLYHALV